MRAWLRRVLTSGPEPNGDEIVVLAAVPHWRGPLTVHALKEAGIAASGSEGQVRGTLFPTTRILVRRRDMDAADRLLDELGVERSPLL